MTGVISRPFNPVTIPLFRAFQQFQKKSLQKIKARLAQDSQNKEIPDNHLYCILCRNRITSLDHTIQINGSTKHCFTNPQGLLFEISCFSEAEGCAQTGTSTLEFTWFHGYQWRYAVCAKCHMHLGWFYQLNSHHFYGLILKSLIVGNQL
jgi:hypothetical protein